MCDGAIGGGGGRTAHSSLNNRGKDPFRARGWIVTSSANLQNEGVSEIIESQMTRGPIGVAVVLALLATSAAAQDIHTFAPASFKTGETVWVTTDATYKGTIVRVDDDGLTLATSTGERTFGLPDVVRIRRRTNHWKLGAAIGAGAGVPTMIYFRNKAQNEGGGSSASGLLVVAMGAGLGAAVDTFLEARRVVYERPGLAGTADALSDRVTIFGGAGAGWRRSSSSSLTKEHLSAGVLFRLSGGPLSAGVQAETLGWGPIISLDLMSRGRPIRPYVNGGYLLPYPGLWQIGGGVDVSVVRHAAIRAGVRHVFFTSAQDQRAIGFSSQTSLELGVIVR